MSKKLIRPSNRGSSSEHKKTAVILLLVFLSITFFSYQLYQEINLQGLQNNKVVGSVSYQKEYSRRRYHGAFLWQRLKHQSPVYNLDRINTEQSSLTLLTMDDGSGIALEEHTLVTIRWQEGKNEIALDHGALAISNNQSVINLNIGSSTLAVQPMSSVNVNITTEGATVTTTEGKIILKGLKGSRELLAGEQASITDGRVEKQELAINLLKPHLDEVYYSDAQNRASVNFEISQMVGQDDTIEISQSPLFDIGVERINSNQSGNFFASLPEGIYFWRYQQNNDVSPTRRFIVAPLPGPKLNNRDEALFTLNSASEAVTLNWQGNAHSSYYNVEVAQDANFTNIVNSEVTSSAQISLYGLDNGNYFYRVTAYSANNKGRATSNTQQFRVNQEFTVIKPKPLKPYDQQYFSITGSKEVELFFNWAKGANLYNVELVISADPSFSSPLIRKKSTHNFMRLAVPTEGADQFYWRIEATTSTGEKIVSDASRYRFKEANLVKPLPEQPIGPIGVVNDATQAASRQSDDADIQLASNDKTAINATQSRNTEKKINYFIRQEQPLANTSFDGLKFEQTTFKWQSNADSFFDLEVASDEDFTQIIHSIKRINDSTITIKTPNPGRYYWRVYYTADDKRQSSAIASFNVVWMLPPVQVTVPKRDAVFETLDANRGLTFRWQAPKAKEFTLTIARDADFKQVVFTRSGPEGSAMLPSLKEGNYFAKIEGVALNGGLYPPVITPFSVKPRRLASATNLAPDKKTVVNMTGKNALTFTWEMTDAATDSTLMLYQLDPKSQTGRRVIHSKTLIRGTSYSFNRLNQLAEGDFAWTIENFSRAAGGNTNSSSDPVEGYFTITLDPLEKVTIKSPTKFKLSDAPMQRIEWNAVPRASRYRIIITTNDDRNLKISDTTTTALFVMPRLTARAYTVTVIALNEFGQPANGGSTLNIVVEE